LKDPSDERFQAINLQNKAFNKRVGNVIGGKVILKEAGFVEDNGFFRMNEPKMDRVAEFAEEIARLVQLMN
jgi:hypothetical protein